MCICVHVEDASLSLINKIMRAPTTCGKVTPTYSKQRPRCMSGAVRAVLQERGRSVVLATTSSSATSGDTVAW